MEPVRIGLIGAGDLGAAYHNAIAPSPAFDLRALATAHTASHCATAGRFGALAAT